MALDRRKALAVAAYLAMAATPVGRDDLAGLLWPELSQERARAALRSTLPALTGAAPHGWLAIDRRTLGLRPEAVAVDARRFLALVAEARADHPDGEGLCGRCAALLREADGLYAGDFLQGFSLSGCPDFEAWQLAQREALRRELGWALQALAGHSWARGPQGVDEALGYGRRWLELDSLNEAAHRQLMGRYAAAGRRGEALRQYHSCAALLLAELGAAPAPETTALFERIARGEVAAAAGPPPQASPPAAPGDLVGREAELALVVARLGDPACRLLTLTGPGGVGKTRLAHQAAAALAPRFAEGAHPVGLGAAHTPAEAVNLIATALGIATAGGQPLAALRGALARRELLLVLDNLEQIPGAAELALDLLAAGPGLRILATSRERLALRAESVLPLSGLAVPADGAAGAEGYGAVELFVRRARQVRPDFALDEASRAAVVRVCALTGGLPLAIELAAAWARTLSPAEIAAEIARSPDFLRAAVRDLPERHGSLRAVFDHSWRLLGPAERAAFSRLAVFRGGFGAEAAQEVAGASLGDLATLEDKSLLWRAADGRFGFHPLLEQYAAERLAEAPAEAAGLRARHGRHVARLVARVGPALAGGDQPAALAELAREGPNLRAAWAWAVEAGDQEAIALMLEGLARFCELRSYRQEGEAALAAAETRLAATPAPGAEARRLLARLQAWRGHFCQFLGRYDDAEAALGRALAAAAALGDTALLAFCRKGQGINANARGEHRRAVALHAESLGLYRALGDRSGVGDALNRIGGAAYDMGDLGEARACWQASYEAYEGLGDLSGMARALNNLGEVCRIVGDHGAARRLAERSLALHAQLGRGWQAISPLNALGMLARLEGRYAEAGRLHAESLALCRQAGDARGEAATTLYLAELELAQGRLEEAGGALEASLRGFRAIGHAQGVSASLTAMAELAVRRGAYGEAAALAREGLAIAEAIPARLEAGRALSTLGLALALGGEPEEGAAALRGAETALRAVGARRDAETAAARRRQAGHQTGG